MFRFKPNKQFAYFTVRKKGLNHIEVKCNG